jgi:hypothetical protein
MEQCALPSSNYTLYRAALKSKQTKIQKSKNGGNSNDVKLFYIFKIEMVFSGLRYGKM